jgi:hypothetical protein
MFSWFRKKKSWVRFYSLDQNVSTIHPVIQNTLVERDWNNLGNIERNRPEQGKQTVLNCPAIKQITRTGYVLCAPAEIEQRRPAEFLLMAVDRRIRWV